MPSPITIVAMVVMLFLHICSFFHSRVVERRCWSLSHLGEREAGPSPNKWPAHQLYSKRCNWWKNVIDYLYFHASFFSKHCHHVSGCSVSWQMSLLRCCKWGPGLYLFQGLWSPSSQPYSSTSWRVRTPFCSLWTCKTEVQEVELGSSLKFTGKSNIILFPIRIDLKIASI